MSEPIGRTRWVIPEGYIPSGDGHTDPRFISHETACILNCGDQDAEVCIIVFFTDREPLAPFQLKVAARRTSHARFNDLGPEPIPRDTDYASLIEASVPIVVQHTRLDSRRTNVALLSTMAYAVD